MSWGRCWALESESNTRMHLPNPTHDQDVTQGQILNGVLQVWILSFPSPRLVAIPKLKSPVYLTILPLAERRIIGGFIPFPKYCATWKQPHPRFELGARVHFLRRYPLHYKCLCMYFKTSCRLQQRKTKRSRLGPYNTIATSSPYKSQTCNWCWPRKVVDSVSSFVSSWIGP